MNTIDTDCRADLRRIYREIETTPLPRRPLVTCQPSASVIARQALIDLVDRGTVRIILDRAIVFE